MTAATLTTKLDRESPEAKARFAQNDAFAQELRVLPSSEGARRRVFMARCPATGAAA